MASLLERIQQIGGTGQQPAQAGIEKILRQKQGKAVGQTGPASTNLGEQAAIGAGQEAARQQSIGARVGQLQQQGQEQLAAGQQALGQQQLQQGEALAQQQLASQAALARSNIEAGQQESRQRLQASAQNNIIKLNSAAERTLRDLASTRRTSVDEMFGQFRFDTADLEDRRDAAQLEQLATTLALQDKAYLAELDKVGVERNLRSEIEYSKEVDRLVMGDELTRLLSELGFKRDRQATLRQQNMEIAQINADTAISLASAAVRDESTRAAITAAGNAASTIVDRQAKKSTPTPEGDK